MAIDINKKDFGGGQMRVFARFDDPRIELTNHLVKRRRDPRHLYDVLDDGPRDGGSVHGTQRLQSTVRLFRNDGAEFIGGQAGDQADTLACHERIIASQDKDPIRLGVREGRVQSSKRPAVFDKVEDKRNSGANSFDTELYGVSRDESYAARRECIPRRRERPFRKALTGKLNECFVTAHAARPAANENEAVDIHAAGYLTLVFSPAGFTETTMHLDVGVPLLSATLPSGTREFASGKYAAAQPSGIEYGTTVNPFACRSPSSK